MLRLNILDNFCWEKRELFGENCCRSPRGSVDWNHATILPQLGGKCRSYFMWTILIFIILFIFWFMFLTALLLFWFDLFFFFSLPIWCILYLQFGRLRQVHRPSVSLKPIQPAFLFWTCFWLPAQPWQPLLRLWHSPCESKDWSTFVWP